MLLALALASPRVLAVAPLLSTQTTLSIPAQPLPEALMALGRQADVQILAASGAVEGRHSPGASGSLPLAQALTRLLQGTDLDYEVVGARTVVVRRRAFMPALSFKSRLRGAKPSVPIVSALDPVQVSGVIPGDIGFKADATRGATRTDTDLADVPQSVSVVTRDLMDSQQAFEVADVVRHVAGVDYVDGFGGPPLFRIRGFNAGNGLTDGMPNGVARIEDLPPLIGVERVEVLKGPEAILGEASVDNNFGGAVNIVMKRPQAEPVRQMTVSAGRYDGTRLGFDFAGALDAQGQLTYRLIAEGNDAHRTAQGYRGKRGSYLAPSIAWRSGGTRLLLGAEYIDNRVPVPDHVVLLGDTLGASSPFDVLPGNAGDHARFRTRRAYYMAEQSLGSGWSLRSRGQYVSQHDSGQAWAFVNTQPSGEAGAQANAYRYSDAFYTLQNELAGHFEQGALTHELLFGFDYARTRTGTGTGNGSDALADTANTVTTSRLHSFNLMLGGHLPSARSNELSIDAVRPLGGSWSTQTGVFAQDQIAVGESWDVLAALRRTTYALHGNGTDTAPTQRRSIWIPRLGVVYKPAPDVSLYASSATGFQADSLLGEDGRPLPPSVSRQLEAGARFGLFDQRARLTVATYRIRLDHSVDLISPEPPYFATPGPGQTNRGVEIEFEGQPLPGLDLSTSYTQARIRNHDGSLPVASPRRQANVWVNYRFQRAGWQAWSVAGGIFARSRSLGHAGDGTYFDIPGQASVELGITYHADRWRMTLGAKNLFARTLYAVDANQSFVPLREGRVVRLSAAFDL
ncbi:TonB-dependent receptor [Rhodanobacter glycinis]|uniref:TonB-dependent receptor n=1 Tax=Rhodanobacter glycinis TaxID=582702 RepID=A0A5B9DWQ0_9GAMM|nr:TonB-dependent receptor [Rhodanobacter glycinis]QEE23799.1 TonB-dependent receptor [Rhodanobacter glycinis]